jgi:hypothetical protein
VWTRDRIALWAMASIFIVFHTIKLFWLVPADLFSRADIGLPGTAVTSWRGHSARTPERGTCGWWR